MEQVVHDIIRRFYELEVWVEKTRPLIDELVLLNSDSVKVRIKEEDDR